MRAFDNQKVGEIYNYTFHFQVISAELACDILQYKNSKVYFYSGLNFVILENAYQSVGNFSINLLDGGFNRNGSSIHSGIGILYPIRETFLFGVSFGQSYGLTNFELDQDQSTRFNSRSLAVSGIIKLDKKK